MNPALMYHERVCLECNRQLSYYAHKRKKFCNNTCRCRYNARKTYHENKKNPKYVARRKKYFKEWLNKNRSHFNDLIRPIARKRARERYRERTLNGLCIQCGIKKDIANRKLCKTCRDKRRVYNSNYTKKRRDKNDK